VLLSSTNRDFQFNVTLCEPTVIVTIPEQTTFCDGLTFSFSQNSIGASSFYWDFGDPTTDDDWSTDANPSWTYADTGVYVVTLIANPGWTCADTVSTLYAAYPELQPSIIQSDFECINNTGWYNFEAGGDFTENATYSWSFTTSGPTQSSSLPNPENIQFDPEASFTATLTVADNGCETTVTETYTPPPPPVAAVPEQETFCGGLTYGFENLSQFADTFFWDFGDGQGTSTEITPEYTYADTGVYTVTLTAMAPFTCPHTTTVTLDVYWLLDAFFAAPEPQCFTGHNFSFFGSGTEESTAVYEWSVEGQANTTQSTSQNLLNVVWEAHGVYDVTLTVTANGCVDSIAWPVEVIQDPTINFSGGGTGCPPFLVHFNNQSFTATTASYLWSFGDGGTSTQANPQHIYEFPGVFDVTLTMITGGGCQQNLTMTSNNAVTSHPLPLAGLDIEPNTVDILEPNISITDLSQGAISCHYYFGDGVTSDDCNPEHSYQSAGYFDVVQTVTNEFGCTATGFGQVLVEGTLFYAPNAFTPDQDGVNDVWLPRVTGYTAYDLRVFNRWGEVIFFTTDGNEPWIGNVKGNAHYAPDGVYFYKCIVHDLKGLPHVFEGHITLIR
jgi:gliding motility-associated-like protein